MPLLLHNPVNQAHIEDLDDRLSAQLAQGPSDLYGRIGAQAVIDSLVETVHAMDRGVISEQDTCEVFGAVQVPGFRFERWLAGTRERTMAARPEPGTKMTGALLGLQVLCILIFAGCVVMARVSRHSIWLWLMGLAALGIVVCAGLTTWSPVLGLGQPR